MAEPLKNLFADEVVNQLADAASDECDSFDAKAFRTTVLAAFPALELKERINLVADELRAGLPADYPAALEIVVGMSGGDDIEGFTAWPLCSFVERHGVDDPDRSLSAMEQLTQKASCEFAIRPFLDHHLEATLDACRGWLTHTEPTVRRLPSEGTRPYLPWGPRVQALLDDPEIGIALITELRHDPDDVVRRSVANHLNDVAKAHPERVIEVTSAWAAEPGIDMAMIRHALRTLVKNGDAGAMAVLGFSTDAEVEIPTFQVEPATISLGDTIELEAVIRSTASSDSMASTPQKLIVDFVIHHVRNNGATTSKVFKWTTIDLESGAEIALKKRRKIATASTRRYHAGFHRIELLVAGVVQAETGFELSDSSD